MQGLRQFGWAILTPLVSVALVIGGLSLALSENAVRPENSSVEPPLNAATLTALAPISPTPGVIIPPPTSTGSAITALPAFTPTNPGAANASSASSSSSATGSCGAPSGWVKNYVVKSGDTLFRIALSYSTTTAALQGANCKGSSTAINVGEVLWVPNVPPQTPGVTVIPPFGSPTPAPTEPLTETALPFTASPSPTLTPSPTHTPTLTPITPDS